MSSPALRSIRRQYTGPILVNIPARHQVQLRPKFIFCGFKYQPKRNALLGRDKTGIIGWPLFNPPIQPWSPYLTMSGCMVGYRLWLSQSAGMVPSNTIDPCPILVSNFTALATYS